MTRSLKARAQHAQPSESRPDDAPPPEDPRFRTMRRLVNLLLIVMLIGFVAVVFALLLRLRDLPAIGVAPLTPHERIISAEATEDRVTLALRDEETGEERIVILDGASFKPIAVLSPPKTPAE